MNKLSKPKIFEASEKSIEVNFGTEKRECTNLLRSGITNQTVVLVADGGKWHEIEIDTLRIDEGNFLENSHLPSFENFVKVHNITLQDLGIVKESKLQSVGLQHEDFVKLEEKFPDFNYVDISLLNDYNISKGKKGSIDVLTDDLRMFTRDGITIKDYITPKYEDIVNTENPQHVIAVDTVPVPVPVDSVSLSIFEKLTPEKITELQGLKIAQEKIAEDNPVIAITDKKSYDTAKRTAAILLSASTNIDGTKGMEATISKYLNTIKTTVKNALSPIAKITREPYDKQKKIIEDWDNRLLLRQQERIKQLFLVPFVFDGTNYSIGSLVITQKEIEDLPDAEFMAVIEKGKAIFIAIESLKSEQDAKITALEEQNRILQEQIKAFMALQNPIAAVLEYLPKEEVIVLPIESTEKTQVANEVIKQYELPNPNNKLLNDLDLAHVSVLEETQYLQCREYYAQALQDASYSINDILVNPDKTVLKSVAITELIKTWKL